MPGVHGLLPAQDQGDEVNANQLARAGRVLDYLNDLAKDGITLTTYERIRIAIDGEDTGLRVVDSADGYVAVVDE